MGGDPPELKHDSSYSQYKRDIRIWQLSTQVVKTKQAGRAVLNMHGKVREHASRMRIEDLGQENGLDLLIAELDKYFKKDNAQELFLAIERLEKYKRDSEKESIVQYIEEFTRRNEQIKELIAENETYADGILAYRLLNQASLSEQDTKLVRATVVKLTYEEMVTALKRCLCDDVLISRDGVRNNSDMVIKQKPMESFLADGEWRW